jgi:nitroreductase
MTKALDHRTPDHPIEPLLVRRWSPRALSAAPITDEEMLTLFEAARWAPSTYNEQEWRFVYARRETAAWPLLFGLLEPTNQSWCARAGMLVVVVGHRVFQRSGKPNHVHLFDCGSAFENTALQGTAMGLVVHGMQGFDYERARTTLHVPEDWSVVAMFAVGRPGDPTALPEALRAREVPSGRKPVGELISEGTFAFGG